MPFSLSTHFIYVNLCQRQVAFLFCTPFVDNMTGKIVLCCPSIRINYISCLQNMCQAMPIWHGRANLTTMFPSLSSPSYCFQPCNVIYYWKEEISTFQKTYTLSWFFLMILIIIWSKVIKMPLFDSPSMPIWPGLSHMFYKAI